MKRRKMSEATKEKLRAAYKKRMAGMGLEVEPDKKPNESSEVEAVVMKVCVNPRLVEAEVGGEALGRKLVDVGRNGNFAIRDEIVVREHPEMEDVLEFVRMVDEGLAVDHVGIPRDRRRVFR